MALDGQKIVIGIDGGGTKTAGVLMTQSGQVLARYEVASTNPHSNPEPEVRSRMKSLIDTLIDQGAVNKNVLDGICLGMAGCDRPADKAFIEGIVREYVPDHTQIVIVNDAVVAMVAVLGRLHGVLVIGGTGSIVLGYHGDSGETVRCGGWGHFLGDEGSGYMIGLKGLQAIMQEFDGRGKATSLTKRILGSLGLASPTDLIGWTYMSGKGKTEIAALARHVHEESDSGDAVAQDILQSQAEQLALQVCTVHRRLFPGATAPVPLALWGGNLINCKGFRDRFTAAVEESGLAFDIVLRDEQAMVGAATHMLNHL